MDKNQKILPKSFISKEDNIQLNLCTVCKKFNHNKNICYLNTNIIEKYIHEIIKECDILDFSSILHKYADINKIHFSNYPIANDISSTIKRINIVNSDTEFCDAVINAFYNLTFEKILKIVPLCDNYDTWIKINKSDKYKVLGLVLFYKYEKKSWCDTLFIDIEWLKENIVKDDVKNTVKNDVKQFYKPSYKTKLLLEYPNVISCINNMSIFFLKIYSKSLICNELEIIIINDIIYNIIDAIDHFFKRELYFFDKNKIMCFFIFVRSVLNADHSSISTCDITLKEFFFEVINCINENEIKDRNGLIKNLTCLFNLLFFINL